MHVPRNVSEVVVADDSGHTGTVSDLTNSVSTVCNTHKCGYYIPLNELVGAVADGDGGSLNAAPHMV